MKNINGYSRGLNMLSWQWPLLFLLLPLPLILRWFMPAQRSADDAIRVPFYATLNSLAHKQQHKPTRRWLAAAMAYLIWVCLLCAAAHPSWVGEPISLPQDQRDLMLAVDISRSMQERDMQVQNRYVERFTAVKAVVGEFIQKRSGDRLGLILFGDQGYLQTPLTFDNKTVQQQLQETQLGFAGNATAIGDAIGLAIKKLRDRPVESRVLILLTDGANTAGTNPNEAAIIAAEANIRIHTVGVGADAKPVRGFFGQIRQTNPSSSLDETTLQYIAKTTGGQYFRAHNPQELQAIYAELDRLEPKPEKQIYRPQQSLTHWPLGIALLLSLLLALGRILSSYTNTYSGLDKNDNTKRIQP